MRIALLSLVLLSNLAFAEIEKFAIPSDSGFKTYWWPKLSEVEGWVHNREASYHYSSNFQLPVGETLNGAETVIYARAIYKPRVPNYEILQDLIDNDLAKFKARDSNINISQLSDEDAKNKTIFNVYKLTPDSGNNWEVISFADEGDFYLMFVVSSRSATDLSESMPAYLEFVRNYE